MKHLYFLAGRPAKAKTLIQALNAGGVDSENIHVLVHDEHVMEDLGGTPGTLEDFSDIRAARFRGEFGGAVTGLALTVTMILLSEAAEFRVEWLVLGTLLGGVFGFIASSIVGSSEDHPIFHEYENRVDKGDVVLAVDVSATDCNEVLALIHSVDPKIEVKSSTLTSTVKMEEEEQPIKP